MSTISGTTATTTAAPYIAPQPLAVLRAHEAAVHSIRFLGNTRLITGDAEGWVILWNLVTRRPKAVWRAHTEPVLKVDYWGLDRIVTHGRDHKLLVWDVTFDNGDGERALDTAVQLDRDTEARRQPSLAHSLDVNALNFCGFSLLDRRGDGDVLLAVPNSLDSEAIDIFQLPGQSRLHERIGKSDTKTGICMALHLCEVDGVLVLLAGYESGHARAFVVRPIPSGSSGERPVTWEEVYSNKSHSQPVLSLDVNPQKRSFYTSSADALIVQHPLPSGSSGSGAEEKKVPIKITNTRHSGQQSLKFRSDGRIFATAGWDSRARVYSTKNMSELAVLKWHKEGCYAVAFGDVRQPESAVGVNDNAPKDDSDAPGTDLATISTGEHRRVKAASETHWLAIGSKDGRVSLWDIY